MKISELLERLGELQGEHGDVPVIVATDGGPESHFELVVRSHFDYHEVHITPN